MSQKLAESSLTDADAKTLQLQPYTAASVAAKLQSLPFARAGFQIPYFQLDGQRNCFFRFRYLEYDNGRGFSRLTHADGKPNKGDVRYGQPRNTDVQAYLPPLMDWEAISKDPNTVIVITEGELKAACGCKHGIATIGLGGVWSFQSSKRLWSLLPTLQAFTWKDRNVYICYDSDLSVKPDVIMARNKLSEELTSLGARVLICTLPTLPDMAKTGMDDYITVRGADSLKTEVLATAVEYRKSEELYRLNAEVVYVRDPGLIMRLTDLQRISPRAFVEHAYSDRVWKEQIPMPKGGVKMVERQAAREWLKWPLRTVLPRATYVPGEGRITQRGELNTWRGLAVEPRRGQMKLWHTLMDYVFADHKDGEQSKRWFQQWLAYPLQHLGAKLNQSVVLWSVDQGTGKSVIGYAVGEIYGTNYTEINDKSLQSGFNEWAENKQFVMGDEIASSGDRKRDTADRMKSIITQRELRLNPKYVPSYTVPDCINYYFTSNHPDAFFMEDSDRRFFVNEIKRKPLEDSFYTEFCQYYLKSKEGPAALLHYLLELNLDGFNPDGHAPLTTDKVQMTQRGHTEIEDWVARLRHDPNSVLALDKVAVNHKLWRTSELVTLAMRQGITNISAMALGKKLKSVGRFEQVCGGDPVNYVGDRLWAIRDAEAMLKLNARGAAEQYYKERPGLARPKPLQKEKRF